MERSKIIIRFLEQVPMYAGGREHLADCFTVEKIAAILPRLSQLGLVKEILELIDSLSQKILLTMPVRSATLAHLLTFVREMEHFVRQQPESAPEYDSDIFPILLYSLRELASSRSEDPIAGPQAPYASVAAFVPLIRGVIRRNLSPDANSQAARNAAYSALFKIFLNDGNSSDDNDSNGSNNEDAVQRRNGLLDFVLSDDFEHLLDLSDSGSVGDLWSLLLCFDDATFPLVFTQQRVERMLTSLDANHWGSTDKLSVFMSVLALLAEQIPVFAQKLPYEPDFGKILGFIQDNISYDDLIAQSLLPIHTVEVLDRILSASSDETHVAHQLLSYGAVKLCCILLRYYLVSDRSSLGEHHNTLRLRVLRVLLSSSTAPSNLAVHDSDAAPENPFLTEFIRARGPQALELLRYDDCMQKNDGGSALPELLQLRVLLANSDAGVHDIAATNELCVQTTAEMRVFVQPTSGWQDAFDAHIACSLEESGFPRRVKYDHSADDYQTLPAPLRANCVPSTAAVALLQARARERILLYSRDNIVACHRISDVVMGMKFVGSLQSEYCKVIRLDNKRFPCNAAHFCVAAGQALIGNRIHTCFVPPGVTSLPYVTFYHSSDYAPCASAPLRLPDSDIVYGEYTEPHVVADTGETATYAVGTVLMYPRAVLPVQSTDTPWFIVFKPCAISLLRGAVPVGRVISCVEGNEPRLHDSGSEPFNAAVLRCFESQYEANECRGATIAFKAFRAAAQ